MKTLRMKFRCIDKTFSTAIRLMQSMTFTFLGTVSTENEESHQVTVENRSNIMIVTAFFTVSKK